MDANAEIRKEIKNPANQYWTRYLLANLILVDPVDAENGLEFVIDLIRKRNKKLSEEAKQ